ncbi:MAG TPA: hypothetical protein VF625_01130 [Longimicrobium sp.]|jgi:hypothetical protein
MADPIPTSVDQLRESVAIRVHSTSLRAVARQVGMSPSGLEKFIAGGTPYTNTRRKLMEWWFAEGRHPRSDLSADGVAVALGTLVRELPPERRERALHDLVGTLRELYQAQGAPYPPWLGDTDEGDAP